MTRKRRVVVIAGGLMFGLATSQILPVADVLVRALHDAGVGPPVARLVVAAVFAIGGIEGPLLVVPLVMKILSSRRRD